MEIKANNLSLRNMGKAVVSGAIFSCAIGRKTALVGPEGSGKKITLLMLGGFLKPSSGSIAADGEDIGRSLGKYREKVGIGAIDRINPLSEELTVRENIGFALEIIGKKHGRGEIGGILGDFKMDAFADTPVKDLAPLQAAVASAACALAADPGIVILDEPTKRLMSADTDIFWEIAGSRLEGKTVIFSTKNLEEAEKYADKIITMEGGRITGEKTL